MSGRFSAAFVGVGSYCRRRTHGSPTAGIWWTPNGGRFGLSGCRFVGLINRPVVTGGVCRGRLGCTSPSASGATRPSAVCDRGFGRMQGLRREGGHGLST